MTLVGLAKYSGTDLGVPVLAALLVTLIPTTIGGLLSAIGIAGMDRLIRFNVVATSGRAVEAAGDVDTLLLDKTGTITFGNRMCRRADPGARRGRAHAWRGRRNGQPGRRHAGGPLHPVLRARPPRHQRPSGPPTPTWCRSPPTPGVSGLDVGGRSWRKGAVDNVVALAGGAAPAAFNAAVDRIARAGGTPLAAWPWTAGCWASSS